MSRREIRPAVATMETILLAITVASLLIALVMSAVAWRVSRQERARRSARVAALALAASEQPEAAAASERTVARAERSVARVSTFAAARTVTGTAGMEPSAGSELPLNASVVNDDLPLRAERSTSNAPQWKPPTATERQAIRVVTSSTPEEIIEELPVGESFLSGTSREQSGTRQRGLAVAAVLLFVLLGGSAYWALSNDQPAASSQNTPAVSANVPLELVSLRQERRGGRLTLSGLVRNPTGGTAVENLAAVVFLFDAQGGFLSSARAAVDFKRLAPGDESPFVISADAPRNVARYRVSFRTDHGIVAHVDRRNDQAMATAAVAGR